MIINTYPQSLNVLHVILEFVLEILQLFYRHFLVKYGDTSAAIQVSIAIEPPPN